MKMKSIAAIFLILFGIALISCEKDDDLTGEVESFYYEETQCSDPWDQGGTVSDEVLKAQVTEYLKDPLGVDYSDLRITHDGTPEICSACSCKTGKIIRVEADTVFQDVLIENGFKVE